MGGGIEPRLLGGAEPLRDFSDASDRLGIAGVCDLDRERVARAGGWDSSSMYDSSETARLAGWMVIFQSIMVSIR